MMNVYTYARHEDEAELCAMELHALLGNGFIGNHIIVSDDAFMVDVNRSPFLKRRIQVIAEASELRELETLLAAVQLQGQTFKVLYTEGDEKVEYSEQRAIEYTVGRMLRGKAEMRRPERTFGIIKVGGRWLFGPCEDNDAIWLKHSEKPCNYSTALPTRAARAIVNIAAGADTQACKLIDPCCGMGTVLIEALSMGIDIEGMDINPLAVKGARANLDHFGYPDIVKLGDMREAVKSRTGIDVSGRVQVNYNAAAVEASIKFDAASQSQSALSTCSGYDAAIVDMPYNLCSVLSTDQQLALLVGVRSMAKRAVIITTDSIISQLRAAGFSVHSCAVLKKASFTRYITVVE